MKNNDTASKQNNDGIINNNFEYKSIIQDLTTQKKPSQVLVHLMTILESYRQKRKIGWSRPWNKYGLTVFKSFVLNTAEDNHIINSSLEFLKKLNISQDHINSFESLSLAPNLKGFVFCHDYVELNGKHYEGITFSLGKNAAQSPGHRDRFDIILETEIINNTNSNNIRIRIYDDPYNHSTVIPDIVLLNYATEFSQIAKTLLELCLKNCAEWNSEPKRHWSHWTQNYIYYFGSRKMKIENSIFQNLEQSEFQSQNLSGLKSTETQLTI